MTDSRKKSGAAFWTVVVLLVALVGYPLSFGPACWVCSRVAESMPLWEAVDFAYAPILRAWWHADPGTISNVFTWYANLGAAGGLTVARQLDGSFCLIHSGWR